MKDALRIIAYGIVQGVFFRQTMKDNADMLGLYGFVRNEIDGTVFIEIEGERDKLNEFLHLCRIGPKSSNVSDLSISEIPLKNYISFEIEY